MQIEIVSKIHRVSLHEAGHAVACRRNKDCNQIRFITAAAGVDVKEDGKRYPYHNGLTRFALSKKTDWKRVQLDIRKGSCSKERLADPEIQRRIQHYVAEALQRVTADFQNEDVNYSSLTIHNIYISPNNSCNNPNVSYLFTNNGHETLILGDFNAHHRICYATAQEDEEIAEVVDHHSLCIFNDDNTTTRMPISGTLNVCYSPDITYISDSLATPNYVQQPSS
ncbi:hypothetical protein niasHT_026729 [Heterodera trifolii]|uniref:Endonuclease/exonuclease/phosphatase domain-containing protein n=1 Tax=Heterodera trifolii TaxID=157864 RepID=A0ABD2JNI2_9BILA